MLKLNLRTTIETLLKRGNSQREVARFTGVSRNTIRSHVQRAGGEAAATEAAISPAPSTTSPPNSRGSACEPYREWIESQLRLERNAQSIYQDLVEQHGFTHKYNAVKRFVRKLKARVPEQFDVLEFIPAEEAQVDYGQGALTLHPNGKYRRPYLFIMTLAYSGKAFRKVVWKTDQYVWAELHQQAFRSFGGAVRNIVLDNLKEGVLKPDLYEPRLNPVYSAMLAHYGVIADPCRIRDPNRKGVVERQIRYTQDTALKGRQSAIKGQ